MRNIIGVFLIAIGAIALVDLMEIAEINFWNTLGDWWPIIFVFIGLNGFSKKEESKFGAAAFTIVGLIWIASNIEIIPLGFWELIVPLLFVTLGLYLIFGRPRNVFIASSIEGKSSEEYVDIRAFFSGQKERITSNNFKGGKIESVFGGIELDLRQIKISDDFEILQIDSIFGGVQIWLPEDIKLITKGTPFFGGLQNSTVNTENPDAPTLHINYSVIFGGIDIKN